MNNILYEVENRTEDIRVKLNSSNSSQRSVINLYGYCEYLLNLNNKQITEAYLSEFVFRYSDHLNNYEPYCIPPSVTQLILQQVQDIACFFPNSEIANSLLDSSELLTKRLNKLNRILTGEVHSEDLINKICFPLVEENNGDASPISTGLLETLTIKISTSKDENKFLIIPSEIKIESNLKTQIDNSWQASIDLLKHYVKKIEPYHEVIIHFDKRVGLYRGNSLGAALTIAFIEELLSYYNSPVIIENNPGIALTGGLKQNGELIEISKEIIEQKVEHVFFSPAQIFIVPVSDKKSAEEKLKILNKDFPGRNLEIIGIETLDELLDSRRLVDISKQKIIVRAGKFAKKNWVSLSVVFILTAVISFFILRDIDTNPHSFRVDGAFLYAVNKNGKVLWEKKAVTSKSQIEDPLLLKGQVKIVDIDSDGRNELLTTIEELVNAKPDSEYSKITCYDSNGESLWSYSFKDKVTSKRTRLPSFYATNIIDTVTISGRKNLVLFANNSPSFSSAIYRLDLKTGKRLPGTFWCSGHTVNGILKDINKDGKKDTKLS